MAVLFGFVEFWYGFVWFRIYTSAVSYGFVRFRIIFRLGKPKMLAENPKFFH